MAALAGCGGGDRQATARNDPVGLYRRAHAAADRALVALDKGEPARTVALRRAAARCLADWRASPFAVRDNNDAVFTLWRVAVTQDAYRAQRPVLRRFIGRVRAIPGARDDPRLRGAIHAVEGDYRFLETIYARRIDPCAVVAAWRRAGWRRPGPPAVDRILRAFTARKAAARRDRRLGRRLYSGFDAPDHDGYCGDPVFEELEPDDTFCG